MGCFFHHPKFRGRLVHSFLVKRTPVARIRCKRICPKKLRWSTASTVKSEEALLYSYEFLLEIHEFLLEGNGYLGALKATYVLKTASLVMIQFNKDFLV